MLRRNSYFEHADPCRICFSSESNARLGLRCRFRTFHSAVEVKNFDEACIPFTPIDSAEFSATRAAVWKQRCDGRVEEGYAFRGF